MGFDIRTLLISVVWSFGVINHGYGWIAWNSRQMKQGKAQTFSLDSGSRIDSRWPKPRQTGIKQI